MLVVVHDILIMFAVSQLVQIDAIELRIGRIDVGKVSVSSQLDDKVHGVFNDEPVVLFAGAKRCVGQRFLLAEFALPCLIGIEAKHGYQGYEYIKTAMY